MSNTSSNTTGGISFVGLLAIVFITLKLCGVITWSWWWVLAPLWISFGIFLAILAVVALVGLACLLLAGIAAVLKSKKK